MTQGKSYVKFQSENFSLHSEKNNFPRKIRAYSIFLRVLSDHNSLDRKKNHADQFKAKWQEILLVIVLVFNFLFLGSNHFSCSVKGDYAPSTVKKTGLSPEDFGVG